MGGARLWTELLSGKRLPREQVLCRADAAAAALAAAALAAAAALLAAAALAAVLAADAGATTTAVTTTTGCLSTRAAVVPSSRPRGSLPAGLRAFISCLVV